MGDEVRPASGGRSTYPAVNPEVAQSRSDGKWPMVGDEDRNATRGSGFTSDREPLSSLCIRPVVHAWRQKVARGKVVVVRYADDGAPRRREGGLMRMHCEL